MTKAKRKRVQFPYRKCDDAAIRLGREAEIARYYREVREDAEDIYREEKSAEERERRAHEAADRATIYTAAHFRILNLSENTHAMEDFIETVSVAHAVRDIAYWAYYADVMQALDRQGETD